MTFWETSTKEQKLTQIDAGIELGMTGKQISMNLGAPIYRGHNAVASFASEHGRRLNGTSVGNMNSEMNFRRITRQVETDHKEAFAIFTHPKPSKNLFSPHQNDGDI